MAIEAWYMDDSTEDQRAAHKQTPNAPVSRAQLDALGVLQWSGLDADNYETAEDLRAIREQRGYNYMDLITCCPDKLENYEAKIRSFFEEHIHADEEIRYCLDGSGYFDVRDLQDRWIRVRVQKGDMIVLPEGIYHRFTLDENNYIRACRLFKGDPVWTPINRPTDEHASRLKYLQEFGQGSEEAKASA